MDLKQDKKVFSTVGLRYFLGFLLVYAAVIVIQLFLSVVWKGWSEDSNLLIVVGTIPMYIVGLPVYYLMMRNLPARAPAKGKMTFGQFLVIFCMGYALLVLSNIVATILGILIEKIFPGAQAATNSVQELLGNGGLNSFVLLLIPVIIGPIYEELLFRKFLIDRLGFYGDAIAIVVSAVMFGLFHGNLTQFVYATMLGLMLGYVYVRTGEIKYTIGLHMLVNFIGGFLAVKAMEGLDLVGYLDAMKSGDYGMITEYMTENLSAMMKLFLVDGIVYGITLVGLILLIVHLVKKRFLIRPGVRYIPKGKRFSTIALNVGMILYFCFCLLLILYSTFGEKWMEMVQTGTEMYKI